MSRSRFVTSLSALLLVFVGGGYAINHWEDLQGRLAPGSTSTVKQAGDGSGTVPSAGTSEGVATAPSSDTATGTTGEANTSQTGGKPETQMKKEFDAVAADAAAKAEAGQQGTASGAEGTATTRSSTSEAELVTASLDAVQLSATGASVIAGQAPTGTTVTLLANEAELATAVADPSGAWTMILDEPVAPGTYKLRLKAVGPNGGDAVFREVGEATVRAPEAVAVADGTASATATSSKAPETVSTAVEADMVVPGTETFDVATVPPDLIAPEVSSAETATTAPAKIEAEAQSSGSTGETQTAQTADTDPSLTDQAGEAAESLSEMFTDWLTATGDEAEEAAKSFSLTGATYKPVAKGIGVVTLSGRGPPKAEVRLFVDTVAVGVTKIADSGRWLAEADHWVEAGAHTARAEIIGTDGAVLAGHELAFASAGLPETVAGANTTALTAATEGAASAPPVLLAIADVTYENMGPKKGRITVGGRAEPAARVSVYADGTRIGTAEAAESGDWTLASDTWLDVGAHAIRAERVAASGEVVESTLTEFVRAPAEVEVAAAETPSAEVTMTSEAAAAAPLKRKKRISAKKSRKAKLARRAHRKRMAALALTRKAGLAKARKIRLAKARGPKLKTVTVQRGNAAVRFKVPIGKRKRQVLGYLRRGGSGWYRVRRGDTLWRIANRCYGNGWRFPLIMAHNGRAIRNPNLIFTRQRIYVP